MSHKSKQTYIQRIAGKPSCPNREIEEENPGFPGLFSRTSYVVFRGDLFCIKLYQRSYRENLEANLEDGGDIAKATDATLREIRNQAGQKKRKAF